MDPDRYKIKFFHIVFICTTQCLLKTFNSKAQGDKDMKANECYANLSLHGFNYLTDSRGGIFKKVFWLLVISIGFTLLIYLGLKLQNDLTSKTTDIELQDRYASLHDVIFPGTVICSHNKYRKSFVLWLHENLQSEYNLKDDKFSEACIKSMLDKAFFDGSKEPMDETEKELLHDLLRSKFLQDYFNEFVETITKPFVDTYPGAYLTNIRKYDFGNSSKAKCSTGSSVEGNMMLKERLLKRYIHQLSGQWKVEQRFLSINWFGNIDKTSKSLVKHNPIMSTSEGICSWLGPLSMPDDELLFTWPKGTVSGEILSKRTNYVSKSS